MKKPEKCHHTGFKKDCVRDSSICQKWQYVRFTDPRTGSEIEGHGCIDGHIGILQANQMMATVQLDANIQKLRNEFNGALESLKELVASSVKEAVQNSKNFEVFISQAVKHRNKQGSLND